MKKILSTLSVILFCVSVSAQSASSGSAFDQDDSLPTKAFKLLIDNADHTQLTGDVKKGESIKPVLNELGDLIAHAFSSLWGGDDDEEDFKTDIKNFDGNCDTKGACFFVIERKGGVKFRYAFSVLLNEKQEPVAIVNNEVRLTKSK